MKRPLVIIILCLMLPSVLSAQLWKTRRYEATASLGTTQFYGDIGGYTSGKNILGLKDISFHNTAANLTVNFRYRVLENVSARLNFVTGFFHSSDVRGSNETRGFNSTTSFFEPSLLGEFYFIKNRGENSFLFLKGDKSAFQSIISSLDMYFYTGIGGITYKVSPNNALASRATNLSGFTTVLPVGVGVRMLYSANCCLGIELGGRFAFVDNLEGYTSEYSKANDKYHFVNFTFTYRIKTGPKGGPMLKKDPQIF
ncbi:MAG TPA: DUF6089 family protein [Bacteroidales bacterium]|nr:DUF6089 family protein [Bacteroidales bacterium]